MAERNKTGFPRLGKQPPLYNFFLNPYRDARFTSCPKCACKTKQRKLPLVIFIEGSLTLSLNKTCRYCPSCDLLISHQDDLESVMSAICMELAPDIAGNEYLVLGTMDRSAWRDGVRHDVAGDAVFDNLHDFKNVWHFDPAPRWGPA